MVRRRGGGGRGVQEKNDSFVREPYNMKEAFLTLSELASHFKKGTQKGGERGVQEKNDSLVKGPLTVEGAFLALSKFPRPRQIPLRHRAYVDMNLLRGELLSHTKQTLYTISHILLAISKQYLAHVLVSPYYIGSFISVHSQSTIS